MSLVKEFRDFAMRGNVVDLAVGVVIGGAFGKIVSSLVGDIIMPAVGSIVKLDFSKYKFVITPAADKVEEVAIRFGTFAQTVIDFTIVAAAIFAVIKLMNAAKRKQAETPAAAPAPAEDILLLREIRDELRNR